MQKKTRHPTSTTEGRILHYEKREALMQTHKFKITKIVNYKEEQYVRKRNRSQCCP